MRERKWTREETQELIKLSKSELSLTEIAATLDRSQDAVRVKAHRVGVGKQLDNITKKYVKPTSTEEIRDCKMCDRPMISTWIGHRICDECKKTELYRCA